MGLHFLGLHADRRCCIATSALEMPKPVGLWGAYVMGLAFAFGWTPCIGPILAAILAVAASEATVTKGAGLLAVYSLGLGMPFMLAAFAIEPFAAFLTRFRSKLAYVEKAMGGLLVLTGLRVPDRLLHRSSTPGCSKPSRRCSRSDEQSPPRRVAARRRLSGLAGSFVGFEIADAAVRALAPDVEHVAVLLDAVDDIAVSIRRPSCRRRCCPARC